MNYGKTFRVKPGSKVKLQAIDADFTGPHESHDAAKDELAAMEQKLWALQYRLYAEGKQSLLICLQALDAAGKDGTIRHVLGAMNPQGCRVQGFKQPSTEEMAHDFLWRIHKVCPKQGEVVVFNRSHYEDVLVVRVHDLVPKAVWSKRYEVINNFEESLALKGTRILKFFLHITPEEQLERFKARLEDPARHWKISESDYSERKLWPAYQEAYEAALHHCSTATAPWYVIPANHKWFRNLAVSKIVVETLEAMDPQFPDPSIDIEDIRQKFHAAAARART